MSDTSKKQEELARETRSLPLGDRIIFLQMQTMMAEEEFDFKLREIFGFSEYSDVPWERETFDYYDASFELKECADDLRLPPESFKRFYEMGFSRAFLCHKDKTESHYSFSATGGGGSKRTYDRETKTFSFEKIA